MGLKILTVEQKNGQADSFIALFNSDYIQNNAYLVDTDDTVFDYSKGDHDVIGDSFWVSETLTTFDDIFTAVNKPFYTLPVHDDVTDSSSDTTNKPINSKDIVFGVQMASNIAKSLLWVQSKGKLEKVLVAKNLYAIEDYVMTGTTTTTTSTTTTSTTTTT